MSKKLNLDLKLPPPIREAIRLLSKSGARCRVVGGSIRDALLNKQSKDFDVEVYGLALPTLTNVLSGIGKTDLVGKSFSVVKLWAEGGEYDFSVPRRESKAGHGHRAFAVEADPAMSEVEAIQRRDFTINALLYDPENEEIIDHCGGLQDLAKNALRHIGPAFCEDPLRVLRAMQFAGRFGFTLHSETAALCGQIKPGFWFLSQERIWEEWRKWATRSDFPSLGLEALRQSGWLPFFAELNALVDLPQDPEWHPEGNAWIHTGKCVDALVSQTDWKSRDSDTRCILMLAVLCHDLGKARCTRFALKGDRLRWISPGHDQASGWLAQQLLQRIGAPKLVIEKVVKLVTNHHFLNTGSTRIPNDASIRRLSRRIEPSSISELVYVLLSDHLGRPPLVSEDQSTRIAAFKDRANALALKDSAPKPLLLGRHLIALGMQPGPSFKSLLSITYEAQLDGAFVTEAGAIAWFEANREKA